LKNIIIKFSGLLVVLLLIEWWLLFFSNLPIPFLIPNTPINISGLLLIITIVSILIFLHKKAFSINSSFGIWKLTLFGTITCFFSEVIFQTARLPTLSADTWPERIYYFLLGVASITFFGAIFSFLIAFQIKTRKTKLLLLFIALFLTLCVGGLKIYKELNVE
jgi:hypothetical protein